MKVLIFLAVAVCACAADVAYKGKSQDYKGKSYDYSGKSYGYKGNYLFYGRYPGKCGNDGIYYRDPYSFVFCSNGNSYVQPCAPGTRNSGYDKYSYGSKYDQRDFCDVNLVDQGYAAHKGYRYPYYHGAYYDRPYGYYAGAYPYGPYY